MKIVTVLLFTVVFLFPEYLMGQTDTLATVDVSTNLIFKEGAGYYTYTFDEHDLKHFEQNDLGVLLEQRSPVAIRRYGPGGLTSASFRGGNANHTLLLWNGLPINSITNGQADLSLLPVGGFNGVQLQFGGESTQWGSGAIGGSIHLQNKPEYNKGLQIILTGMIGSFSNRLMQSRVSFSTQKSATSVFVGNQIAKNNFPFYNTTKIDAPKEQQPEMDLRQHVFMVNHFQRIAKNQEVAVFYWYQNNDKFIPPTMTQPDYNAQQRDGMHKIAVQWKMDLQNGEVAYRSGLFFDVLAFNDSTQGIYSNTQSQTWVQDAQYSRELKSYRLQIGAQLLHQGAHYADLGIHPTQTRASLYSSFHGQLFQSKLEWSVAGRAETVSGDVIPFVYNTGIQYAATPYLFFRLNAAKLYRVPTLNDLYWVPGGNPDLLPEYGYTYETGLTLRNDPNRSTFHALLDVNWFSRRMNNWIMWLPENALWTAQNLLEVWSRGIETRTLLERGFGQHKLHTELKTNYIISTQESSTQPNDAAIGKQILYVPMYTGQWLLGWNYKGLECRWISTYTGYRYTASDHSSFLPPFWMHGIQLAMVNALPKNHQMRTFLRVNNLFNAKYQFIQNRPMPLANYETGITLYFNP
ncbi:MAG: TonB-dependent receptor [Schleiferiaceae bacterium]|nr:TonB-dependent receptor [Schleiferiaceae bacterium]